MSVWFLKKHHFLGGTTAVARMIMILRRVIYHLIGGASAREKAWERRGGASSESNISSWTSPKPITTAATRNQMLSPFIEKQSPGNLKWSSFHSLEACKACQWPTARGRWMTAANSVAGLMDNRTRNDGRQRVNSNRNYLESPKTLAAPLPLFSRDARLLDQRGRECSGINRQAGPCPTPIFSLIVISSLPYFNPPLSYRSSSTCLFLPYSANMAGPALPLKATVNCDMGEVRLRKSYLFIGAFELTPSDVPTSFRVSLSIRLYGSHPPSCVYLHGSWSRHHH